TGVQTCALPISSLPMLHNTRGGSRDTDEKLLAVIARGVPSASRAVITVTPVAKEPRVLRSWRVSNSVTGRLPRRSVVVVVVVAERLAEGIAAAGHGAFDGLGHGRKMVSALAR